MLKQIVVRIMSYLFNKILLLQGRDQRWLAKEEVSNLVLFLTFDESSYMTASENVIDVGLTAR